MLTLNPFIFQLYWLYLTIIKNKGYMNRTLLTDELTYSGSTKTFTAEASELALDQINLSGYKIHNPKTGVSQFFAFRGRITIEGETQAWEYKSREGINFTIYND